MLELELILCSLVITVNAQLIGTTQGINGNICVSLFDGEGIYYHTLSP